MLSSYRVLDLTSGGAGVCGQILADLGADVVLIEPPGGSPSRQCHPFVDGHAGDPDASLAFWGWNRGKRSVVLDIESSDGKSAFRKLVQTADFVIEAFEPGHMASLGLGYDDLAAINPAIILVSISSFGQTGPKAGWAANDLTALASSNVLVITGDEDRAPVRVTVPQAFAHAGGEAAVGALIAHVGRERDGVGQHVDVSAQGANTYGTQSTVLAAGWGEGEVKRVAGGLKLGSILMRLINPCKDGYVSVTFLFGTAIGPFTRRLMEVMYAEGIVDEATRDKDWIGYTTALLTGQEPMEELFRCIGLVQEFTKSHTKDELFQLAMEKSLLIVPVATTADVVQSEQLASRAYWTEVEHPELGRMVVYPGPFAKLMKTPISYQRRPPLLGEHTAEVLGQQRQPRAIAGTLAPGAGREMPLAGLKVLDFMWVVAGPTSSRYLSDYGATIVRVESTTKVDTARTVQPFRDGMPGPNRSGLFANLNAGKLGLTLNPSRPEGREVVLKLVRWADVVLESYSPRGMASMGLDYEALKAVNPGLIMLSSCLNGHTGPHATLAGFGTMGGSIAGFGELTGWPDRPPAGPWGAYTDYVSPKYTTATILAALDHRRRTGEGQYVDFSQVEASIHFLAPAMLEYTVNGRVMPRNGNASFEFAPHAVFPAAGDDRWVAIAAESEAQWRGLCRAMGSEAWLADPRFATNAARLANRDALEALIADWTRVHDVDAIEQALQREHVPCHRASTTFDMFDDPQLQHRGHFVTLEHAELGPIPVESSRMRFSATPSVLTRPGPVFGQDNDYVLREILGMGDDEIVELVAAGALE